MTVNDPVTPRLAAKTPAERVAIRRTVRRRLAGYIDAIANVRADLPADRRQAADDLARACTLALEELALLAAERDSLLTAAQSLEAVSSGPNLKLIRMALSSADGAGQNAATHAVERARQ